MTTPRAFETLNPSALPPPPGGAHVSIVTGGRLVYVAGQIAQVLAGFQAAAERVGSLPAGAGTLLPVARLFDEAHLIEIEATAVLP